MTAQEILDEIKPLGSEKYKRVIFKYGVTEPCYGVKIGDLQKIVKRIKKDYQLALDLFETGVYDAMYLAGLIADDAKMTKKDLKNWITKAYCRPLCGWTVAWVAAGSPRGWELALSWIDSKKSLTAVAGWATFGSIVSVVKDEQLDLIELKKLLERVQSTIHDQPDAVRYQMNAFVISVGSYVAELTDTAVKVGKKVGPITADLGDNDCKTPYSPEYIEKIRLRGSIGKKRKTAKC
jgi:3-methyladenine DNA glycosylase AlkD